MQQPAPQCKVDLYLVLATMVLHGGMMVADHLFFWKTNFLLGIDWIYLPAGTRLLCTLLFGRAGAVGLLIVGWAACYWFYYPGDAVHATTSAISGAIGPYLVYVVAQRRFGLQASLINLTPKRLLLCAVGCSVASPLLHQVWFVSHRNGDLFNSFCVMFIGDLAGTLIVVYSVKGMLALLPGPRRPAR